ncbi:unnamed protein product [Tilletia laevis]|uniref:Uncharacterized protein n=3 Tax=Tilletia TaxID=13289 RepID=A0A8X7MSD4_9BASI|nr:hypothetical protein CF336_g5739 [Tilletia laevis]KAE8192590.1 hypothetical protein CF328_g5310 [Tilletia controversa]KAE8259773.1 hypothetical protein A4X03_0g3994 [Tilletia caries]KAE8195836.1 hypothetical protein CF335_g5001 [Tilletia laevis]KAE8247576.1 hypothetical protein A4X06_0g4346 [Tilletia controversa]
MASEDDRKDKIDATTEERTPRNDADRKNVEEREYGKDVKGSFDLRDGFGFGEALNFGKDCGFGRGGFSGGGPYGGLGGYVGFEGSNFYGVHSFDDSGKADFSKKEKEKLAKRIDNADQHNVAA